MLDWDQARQLAVAGVEIGGHSHTHPQLDQLSDDRLWFEITRCKQIVADELGVPPVSFAYPYGYSSRRVRRAVRGAGFRQALAVGNALAAPRQGPYALARLTVRRSTGTQEFARLVAGRGIGRFFAGTGRSPRGTPWSAGPVRQSRQWGRCAEAVSDTTTRTEERTDRSPAGRAATPVRRPGRRREGRRAARCSATPMR
ncbi:hypothetical protein SRIMM317S_05564 [Streptomyces rimosus subsp. rimosus]